MNEDLSIPLCVDLDGTLVKLDTLHQALFLLLRRSPLSILRIPGWIAKGKAHLKDQVMQRVALDASALPYNQTFLDYLRKEHETGRKLVLATASNYRTADAVAEHLGIFSDTISSSVDTNMRHTRKLEAIRMRFPRFGYAGNDVADFPIWDTADEIIVVNPSRRARAAYAGKADRLFEDHRPLPLLLFKAMRCRQWIKNLLIFAPLFLAHRFTEADLLVKAVTAFFSFSLAASAIYVLNDLFDLSADQHHPRKHRRPFASGDLPIATGAFLIPALAASSLLLALALPPSFTLILLAYFAVTSLYSWCIKQIPVLDVVTLAVLYATRIVAGSTATDTPATGWFIGFSISLFLGMALAKRYCELRELKEDPAAETAYRERGYQLHTLPLLMVFGLGSCLTAISVLIGYLFSDKVQELYARPMLLAALCPVLLLWIVRIWRQAYLGKMHDDPVAHITKDAFTYVVAIATTAIILFSI